MGDFGGELFDQLRIDVAALHPALQLDASGSYFSTCQKLRAALKQHLRQSMGIEHDLFLTSNATAGLVTTIAGLSLDGIGLNLERAAYPGYAPIRRFGSVSMKSEAILWTHVDPLSGHISSFEKSNRLSVLDASQSFGTICWHREAFIADIVVSGLQKHAGIAAGLGILAIRKDLECKGLRHLASVAEQGTVSHHVMQSALERSEGSRARLFNRLVLNVYDELIQQLSAYGIETVTPVGANLPFVCVTGQFLGDIGSRSAEAGLSAKYFRDPGILRISGYAPGFKGDPPLDRSDALADVLMPLKRKE